MPVGLSDFQISFQRKFLTQEHEFMPQICKTEEYVGAKGMKFKYTILYVENVKETLAFYCSAFGLKQRLLHESGDYGELDTGTTTLSFSSLELMKNLGKSPSRAAANGPVFEIAFETDDVQAGFDRALEAGAISVQEPEDMPWRQTIAYVSDKNGFLIEICTPVGI